MVCDAVCVLIKPRSQEKVFYYNPKNFPCFESSAYLRFPAPSTDILQFGGTAATAVATLLRRRWQRWYVVSPVASSRSVSTALVSI